MSESVFWNVVPAGKKVDCVVLKIALKKKFGPHKNGDMLNSDDIPWLNGVLDAGGDGAQELIDALVEHDRIEVSIG